MTPECGGLDSQAEVWYGDQLHLFKKGYPQ